MSHATFYRKYRSGDFGELVGQSHVIQTLSNAITHDRLSHAYIFSGPRGTGKTSSARILAKSLNCRNGKSLTPCGVCDLCRKIAAGQSVDVIEIDAASNTGVDNIRVLNDHVGYAPVECRYRLFIIDEAHMLSSGAFNALLKTLEEPPSYVVFVLATTEPHKIPATIHSRCQHLQFRKLTIDEISGHLRHIATEEDISISDNGLRLLARNASGCMRDAISLFDQLYSFTGNQVQDSDIQSMLGAASVDSLNQLMDDVLNHRFPAVMESIVGMMDSGVHPIQLIEDSIEWLKQFLFFKFGYETVLDPGLNARFFACKDGVSAERVQWALEKLSQTVADIRHFPDPQLLVQIRLLGITQGPSRSDDFRVPNLGSAVGVHPQSPRAPVAAIVPVASSSPVPDHFKRLNDIRDAAFSKPAVKPPSAPVVKVSPPVSGPVGVPPTTVGDSTQRWGRVLDQLKVQKQALHSMLNLSQVESVDGQFLTIKLKQDFMFFREKIREAQSQAIIAPLIQAHFGNSLTLRFSGESDRQKPVVPVPSNVGSVSVSTPTSESTQTAIKKINHIIALFEGAIVEN